jgi:hypothetical protein
MSSGNPGPEGSFETGFRAHINLYLFISTEKLMLFSPETRSYIQKGVKVANRDYHVMVTKQKKTFLDSEFSHPVSV